MPALTIKEKRKIREYTLSEEIANATTHGIGALLALIALPFLIILSLGKGKIYLAASLIYGITMILEYTMSTLYHAVTIDRVKHIFKVLDHSGIYLFIAGSYTPFCLISLAHSQGQLLCLFVWIVAIVGVACEAFWVFRPRWLSVLLYLILGWSVIWFLPDLMRVLPKPGLYLLIAGGLCYSVGCIFYVLKRIPFMHTVFHLWVLAGSICHFLAISLYII